MSWTVTSRLADFSTGVSWSVKIAPQSHYIAAAGQPRKAWLRLKFPAYKRPQPMTPDGGYKLLRKYSVLLGLEIGAHALRETVATNVLDHDADIVKLQEWLGHANIARTRICDHRKIRLEDSPTYKIAY